MRSSRPTTSFAPPLRQLHGELEERNQSAAGSLAEGLDETLTLHRLGVYDVLGRSLKTTNCLESINALVEERCAKVDHWQNSSQRHRWLATALLDIEPRLRKVMGYRHLPKLREALQRCFRHQLLLPHPYLVLTKPLRLDIQCQRAASVKIGWKYLDD